MMKNCRKNSVFPEFTFSIGESGFMTKKISKAGIGGAGGKASEKF
jgi:hypothetical protein